MTHGSGRVSVDLAELRKRAAAALANAEAGEDIEALVETPPLTAEDAASYAGVSRRTWQKWERAGAMPHGALVRFKKATGLEEGEDGTA